MNFIKIVKKLSCIVVMLVYVGFSPDVLGDVSIPESVSFQNFGDILAFRSAGQGLVDTAKGFRIRVSDRLIVKMKAAVDVGRIYAAYERVQDIKVIFEGKDRRIYLVILEKNASLQTAIVKLNLVDGVELVQPDILQLPYEVDANTFSDGRRDFQHSGHEHDVHFSEAEIIDRTNTRYLRYLEAYGLQKFWKKSTGKGVRLAIIDDGFNFSIPALKHVKPVFTYDVLNLTPDVSPRNKNDKHGTKVAGIIFSSHQSGVLKGIAPDAELIALRNTLTWTSQTILALQLARLNGADIINCSWNSLWLLEPVFYAIEELAVNGRNGKGVALVFSSGNKGKEILPFQTEAAIESALVTGSQNMLARRLPNSNYGKSVDFYNYGLRVKIASSDGGIADFSGTSLAAAITSGLAALILSERPELTLAELENELRLLSDAHDKKVKVLLKKKAGN